MYLLKSIFYNDNTKSCLQNTAGISRTGSRQIRRNRHAFSCHAIRIISAFLAVIFVLPSVCVSTIHAEVVTNATVIVSSANVRSTPQSDNNTNIIDAIARDQRVAAGSAEPSIGKDTYQWCSISYEKNGAVLTGYVVYSFLAIDDTSYASSLRAAGFPDSYIPYLTKLHSAHPNWIFNSVMVGTDWSAVVAEESKIGRSLITSSCNDAWKSTDTKAYNWLTNTYTPYDGTSWVNASSDVVAYYLDPRNFLGESLVFQFLNLSYDAATQTQEAVQKQLSNTFMAGGTIGDAAGNQIPYAQAFMQAGSISGSSPYQLVSRVVQEVSAQGSRSTKGTEPGYEGYYNFYNIGASSAADPVILGLNFAVCGSSNQATPMSAENQAKYLIPWNSQYRSIVGGAVYVSANYIQKGQNTLYFQKFDVTDGGNGTYWHQYMTNIQAMTGESSTLYKAYSKSNILDVALTFNIPVYTNMPAANVAQPAQTGNPNNYLTSLSIDGYSLTPSFDPSVTDGYSLIVPYQISSVNLTTAAVAATSAVGGTGVKELAVGENPTAITVTAQNGTVRTYNISIIRNEQTGEDLFTTTYRVNADNTIAGIEPGTTIGTMSAGFVLSNGGQIVFLTSAGAPITDPAHVVVTGDRVQFLNAASVPAYDYTILIYGDANNDGKINSTDLTVICRHVLKETSLSGFSLLAADANHDGKANSTDLTTICKYVLKESTILQ